MHDNTMFFIGVNPGYSSNSMLITDPIKGKDKVEKELTVMKWNIKDKNEYTVYPAMVVYDIKLGCPKGGEVAPAVVTKGTLSSVEAMAESLLNKLEQNTLSLTGASEGNNKLTKGFNITVEGASLEFIARLWQDTASTIKETTISEDNKYGTFVSAGVYDKGNGIIVIDGVANPRYFTNDRALNQWVKVAGEVAKAVALELKQELKPEFREVEFAYLRAKGKENSRGERD
jgi:hypothetical protein